MEIPFDKEDCSRIVISDDSDSDFDDMEDSVQQIFTSLGDSHVIRSVECKMNKFGFLKNILYGFKINFKMFLFNFVCIE